MADDDAPAAGYRERGLRLRREVLGDAHVDRSLDRAADDAFLGPVQELANEFGWGAVWARPGR